MLSKATLSELFRFAIVGTVATALHYAIYWVLQHWVEVNVAYTVGYVLSFIANYLLTARFTFRKKVSARNGLGFSGAHLTNYCLHIVMLNFFLWLGLSAEVAPLAVFCVVIPVNFLLVRLVFHRAG